MADAKDHTGWAWDAALDGSGQCWEKTGSASLVGDDENCHASKVLTPMTNILDSGILEVEWMELNK